MTAFYNEPDPYAAAWLENLIAAGHIAPGIVDRRPIQEIEAWELAGFTQCHFFAGIGVWSHALRRAGWSEDRPIWTGSCPCQPFSAAGQRKGISDERHLWPYWIKLIEQCHPAIVLGEQVASKDGLGWLDLVSADLEGAGYAFGASDLCAAGFGGAHIRQRLYFVGVADALYAGRAERWPGAGIGSATGSGAAVRVADAGDEGKGGRGICRPGQGDQASGGGEGRADGMHSGYNPDPSSDVDRPGAPMLGRDPADWLYCRDGKWRPVESGTFPLVDAAPARVGRLRAYGNALDAETATNFCEVVREIADDLRPLEREFDL